MLGLARWSREFWSFGRFPHIFSPFKWYLLFGQISEVSRNGRKNLNEPTIIASESTKILSSIIDLGWTQFLTASIFWGSTITPSLETTWPKNETDFNQNSNLKIFPYNFVFQEHPDQYEDGRHDLSHSLNRPRNHQ